MFLVRKGPLGSTAGTFRKKFRKKPGKTPETLSERFLEFPSRVRLGSPKPYNSRHLRLPEHFHNSLPPSTAGRASFFRSGSGEGLSEPVMEFPAVLRVFLNAVGPKVFSSLIIVDSLGDHLCQFLFRVLRKLTSPESQICNSVAPCSRNRKLHISEMNSDWGQINKKITFLRTNSPHIYRCMM